MSEHRRKPPQGRGRRAAQPPQSSGRRAAPPSGASGSPSEYGSRAEARKAAQRNRGGGRRRAAAGAAGAGAAAAAASEDTTRLGRVRPEPEAKRFVDYPRSGKEGVWRWVPSWKQVLGAGVAFLGLMVLLSGIAFAMVGVPNPNEAAQQEKNVYYWADGSQMVVAGGGDQNRQTVPLSEIPESMQNAVIAAENESFYQDSGVDPMGIVRAVGRMALGGETQSGSTITQQYVKNTYLDQSQTILRKVKELFISIKVGATEEKTKILEGYLNTAYYGRGAYGIQAAAQAYYRKDSKELTPSESAFLSSTVNGPNMYDPQGGIGSAATPAKNLARAKARWEWTLDREVATGRMSKAERAKYTKFPMPKQPKKSTELKGQNGYMVDLANNYITANSEISDRQLKKGGYKIHTTFQKHHVQQMKAAVARVRKQNLDPKRRNVDKYVQFGGASVKPGDGAITAIYGGDDATTHFTNNADYTGVQVGSTFKPFVMAAAMRDGVRDPSGPKVQSADQRTPVSPQSVYNGDNKLTLRDYDGSVWHDREGREWHQRNDGNEDKGRVDLRTAMQHSVNTPFIQLGMDVGTDKVKQAALDAGLTKDNLARTTPSFSLGTSAPSAIRMANAYGTFAKSGMRAEPYSVTKVEKDGSFPYKHKRDTKSAFDPAVADNITSMLETVVQKGTGSAAKAVGRPAAGKTGTTDDNKSAWFTGYTPQLSTSIGMWRVNDQAKVQKFMKMYGVGGQESIHGASYPAEIWTKYTAAALKGQPALPFQQPTPIGKKWYGKGASPSPTPTPTQTPTPTPSETPSETTPSPTESSEPSPTDTCKLPFGCDEEGTDQGTDQGTSAEPSDPVDPGGDPGGDSGGDTGGLFGGPDTGTGREPKQ